MSHVYLGLGSNLGDRENNILGALDELFPQIIEVSSLYESAPINCREDLPFLNCVACIETTKSPHQLLNSMQSLEEKFGRVRTHTNAPRTLDIDLLLYDDVLRIETPHLTLPHSRMHERLFVLEPLLEINPHITHYKYDLQKEYQKLKSTQDVELYVSKKEVLLNLHFV